MSKAELPHPVYAYVYRIALRFPRNYVDMLKQGKYVDNACVNWMCEEP